MGSIESSILKGRLPRWGGPSKCSAFYALNSKVKSEWEKGKRSPEGALVEEGGITIAYRAVAALGSFPEVKVPGTRAAPVRAAVVVAPDVSDVSPEQVAHAQAKLNWCNWLSGKLNSAGSVR